MNHTESTSHCQTRMCVELPQPMKLQCKLPDGPCQIDWVKTNGDSHPKRDLNSCRLACLHCCACLSITRIWNEMTRCKNAAQQQPHVQKAHLFSHVRRTVLFTCCPISTHYNITHATKSKKKRVDNAFLRSNSEWLNSAVSDFENTERYYCFLWFPTIIHQESSGQPVETWGATHLRRQIALFPLRRCGQRSQMQDLIVSCISIAHTYKLCQSHLA